MIKTRLLEQFYFSKKRIDSETQLVPPSEDSRDENYYWKKPKIYLYQYKLEFPETILLSRIIFIKPSPVRFSLEISNNENENYIMINKRIQCTNNAMKFINIGWLPCRFIRFITQNDKAFPPASKIKCYGYKQDFIEKKHGKEMAQLFFNKPSYILYGNNYLSNTNTNMNTNNNTNYNTNNNTKSNTKNNTNSNFGINFEISDK
jgi:hypothetical protein